MAFGLGGLLGIGAKGIGSMLGSEFGQNVIGSIMGNQKIQQGIGQQNKVISGLGDEDKIRGVWDQSQGIVGKMTNFGQYSGAAMDLASQKGNQGVETAMQMGQGGSQANAIKNRLKQGGMAEAYGAFNKGLGQAGAMQMNIDQGVSGEMSKQLEHQRDLRLAQGQAMQEQGGMMMPDMFGKTGLLSKIGGGLKGWANR